MKKAAGRNRETAACYYSRKQFKILLQKIFEITTESSPTILTAKVDGAADLSAGNLPQPEKFHKTTVSSLPDYIWS